LVFACGPQSAKKKNKLPNAERDEGPDFCIQKGRRLVWIELIAPSPGDESNLDKIPDLFASGAESDSRRKVELRIASALKAKTDKFARYREKGIIDLNDSCVVAIAASQFALEADAESGAGLPLPVTTVYPFDEEVITIDPVTAEFASLSHRYSGEIERAEKNGKKPGAVLRTASQNDYFAGIDGLIWSRRSTGNSRFSAARRRLGRSRRARSRRPCRWSGSSAASHPLSVAAVEGAAGGAKIAPVSRHAG
jgi:hypothetical protein